MDVKPVVQIPPEHAITRTSTSLPDLTSRIQSMGMFEEYQRFRDLYLEDGLSASAMGADANWLAGRGTHGSSFNRFYPTYKAWQHQRSYSFWISVCFLQGSLLYSFGCGFGISPPGMFPQKILLALTTWPLLFGGIFFGIGSYLMCLECINIMRSDTEEWQRNPFKWRTHLAYIDSLGDEVSRNSYLSGLVYLIGIAVYHVGLFPSLLFLSGSTAFWLTALPLTIGGGLFFIAGYFECLQSKAFSSAAATLTWWGAVLNFIGGGMFFFGGAVLLLDEGLLSSYLCTFGGVTYTAGSAVNIVLWKDKQFGLAFLAGLNQFRQGNGPASSAETSANDPASGGKAFSARGIGFIVVYCFIAVISLLDFCLVFQEYIQHPCWVQFNHAVNSILPCLLIHMVLLLHSAVVQTPKIQPFHFLIISMRYMALGIGANSVCSFVLGVLHGSIQPHEPAALLA